MKLKIAAAALAALFASSAHAEPAAGSGWTEPNTGIRFVYIPSGCFNMGSKLGTPDAQPSERPVHQVCFKTGFYMSTYKITKAQAKMVLGEGFYGIGERLDETAYMSSAQAQQFVQELNSNSTEKFSLPSEAQWEYACRAGGEHTYCGSNNLSMSGGWGKNTQFNAWGLYEMNGGNWELMQDTWHDNYKEAPTDGSAWEPKGYRGHVIRGGNRYEKPSYSRAAYRSYDGETYEANGMRFEFSSSSLRLVRTLP